MLSCLFCFFFSSRRRHTRCALVTGVQTCALPIFRPGAGPPPSPEGVARMLNLAEYRRKPALLADHLPWAALVAPGVVLNKDGSFQRSFRFRGPDLESATEPELVATCARLNNVLRRFGGSWARFFEAERHEAPGYPRSEEQQEHTSELQSLMRIS